MAENVFMNRKTKSAEALVEVLTAEVRTLMVGSRQITLSVYRQLDWCEPDEMTPFGRVSDNQNKDTSYIYAIGKSDSSGALVRSKLWNKPYALSVFVPSVVVGRGNRFRYKYSDAHDEIGEIVCNGFTLKVITSKTIECNCQSGKCDKLYSEHAYDCTAWWFPTEKDEQDAFKLADKEIAEKFKADEKIDEWKNLPLIVLAGLR